MKNQFAKSTFVFLISAISFFSCSDDSEFTPIKSGPFTLVSQTLEGITVNELVVKGDMIYAATTDGLYGRKLNSSDVRFKSMGLKGKNIRDIHPFSISDILASEVTLNSEGITSQIFQTRDEGENWEVFESNFGGESTGDKDGLGDFESVPSQPNHLYASGNRVVAFSSDRGKTWQPVWGEWGSAGAASMNIKVNPLSPTEVWGGGQGNIENGYLFHINQDQEINYWDDLVPNPTVVKEILFDSENPQTIYVGWEGELNKTVDNGNTWTTLIDRHSTSDFFFGLGLSSNDPNTVFAGKWIKGGEPQNLEIYFSKDKGNTWVSHAFTHINYGGIWDLKVVKEGDTDRIFLGLDKGGVVEVKYKPE